MTTPDRKKAFKPQVDQSQARRKRMEEASNVQKVKREDSMKRRRVGENHHEAMLTDPTAETQESMTIEQVPQVLADPSSDQKDIILAIEEFRVVFDSHKMPIPGTIPLLLRQLQVHGNSVIVLASVLFTLEYIVTDHKIANDLYRHHAIQIVAPLLGHNNDNIKNKASLFLEKMASDNMLYKDTILAQNRLLEYLIQNMKCPQSLGATLPLVATLCDGTSLGVTRPLVPHLRFDLIPSDAKQVVRAFSYLSTGPSGAHRIDERIERIQAVIESDVTNALVHFLQSADMQMVEYSLACLQNFLKGNDIQTQVVVDAPGALSAVGQIIDAKKGRVSEKACQLIRDLSRRAQERQITVLLTSQTTETRPLLQSLVEAADPDEPKSSRNLALFVLTDLCLRGTEAQVLEVFRRDGLKALTRALGPSMRVLLLPSVLDAIDRIWKVSAGNNEGSECIRIFEENDGIEKLEGLLNYRFSKIQGKAWDLMDRYEKDLESLDQGCSYEEDTLDENLAPALDDGGCLTLSSPVVVKRLDYGPLDNHGRSEKDNTPRTFGNPNNRGM